MQPKQDVALTQCSPSIYKFVKAAYLQHVWVVVADGNGGYVGEDVEHGVAICVEDVVPYGLVVVGEERHRGHGLDGILRRIHSRVHAT